MPREIGLDETRLLIDRGAQVVEVLPRKEFEEEHLPGAVNIPLKALTRDTTRALDEDRPIVVYCWDDV
jgi:rhodanese-related sulfurtransferase